MNITISDDFFFTDTPVRLTSSGKRGSASATRFCTSTLAVSRCTPDSKVTVKFMLPSFALTELI